VSELKKPPTKPKRAKHRQRSWSVVDALLLFGKKIVHEKQTQTAAREEIAETFGLKSYKTISDNADFKAGKAMILNSFKRAHFKHRARKSGLVTG
jgi:hypothetical protein